MMRRKEHRQVIQVAVDFPPSGAYTKKKYDSMPDKVYFEKMFVLNKGVHISSISAGLSSRLLIADMPKNPKVATVTVNILI